MATNAILYIGLTSVSCVNIRALLSCFTKGCSIYVYASDILREAGIHMNQCIVLNKHVIFARKKTTGSLVNKCQNMLQLSLDANSTAISYGQVYE